MGRTIKTCFILAIAAVCACALASCKQQTEFQILTEAGDAYFTAYVTPDSGASPNITIADLYSAVLANTDTDAGPYVIDLRSETDYNAGHIIGAVNLALADLDDEIPSLPLDRDIVFVCHTGQTSSFATAIVNLVGQDPDYAGLEARSLKFGMCSITTDTNLVPKTDKWVTAVASDEFALTDADSTISSALPLNEAPDPATGASTLADIIIARLDTAASGWSVAAADLYIDPANYFIANYWPADQYADPGHIPTAVQYTPKLALRSDEDLLTLPTDETVVVYCYTGQTSAQMTAYLRLLGYDARSLSFGANGFAYDSLPAGFAKYSAPATDYSAILE